MGLSLKNICKSVDNEIHLDNISLEFESGSRNVVLGRTLAGKTSLLRIMAGLDRPNSGRILIDGKDVTGISVRKRSVAMVYQQFINYPSLNVYKNIASPLRMSGMDSDEMDRRVRETAEMLHLTELLHRLPSELSGGQQQRIAIARALVKDAQLLLMDEPLVNLDYKLREELREELREIFEQREAVVVYTTTEPTEALMLGGNIVVMDEGRVIQAGPTADVYHRPEKLRVAEIFSDPPINYMRAGIQEDSAILEGDIRIPLNGNIQYLARGEYMFGVRANHLFLDRRSEKDIEFQTKVELSEINGSETFIHANHADRRLVVHLNGIHSRKIGSKISLFVNPDSFFVFNGEGVLVAAPGDASGSDQE